MTSLLILATLLSAPSYAQDSASVAADDEDDFFTEKPNANKGANAGVPDGDAFAEKDDLDIPATPKPEAKITVKEAPKPPGIVGMPADVATAAVLGDNWSPVVSIAAADAVVIDMPVLYAKSKADFDGKDYWLVAEVFSDGKKLAESRTAITKDMVADKAPSVQFFRLFAPVAAASGLLEVKVGKASAATAKPEALIIRSVKYTVGA